MLFEGCVSRTAPRKIDGKYLTGDDGGGGTEAVGGKNGSSLDV